MSNVVQRKRQVSGLQFYVNAVNIRSEVLSIVENESYVPKRKRFLIGISTFTHAKNIIEFITIANTIYPYNPDMLFARKWYQQKAICMCEVLIEDIRLIMENNDKSQNRLMTLTNHIINEVQLLRKWRNASKILKHKGKYKIEEDQNNNQNTESDVVSNNEDDTINTQEQVLANNPETNSTLQLMVLLEESWPIDKSY